MFFSKSTLFSIATASMFVANVSAEETTADCVAGSVSTIAQCTPDENLIDTVGYKKFIDVPEFTGNTITFPPEWSAVDLNFKYCGECAAFKNKANLLIFIGGFKTSVELFRNFDISASQPASMINAEKTVTCFPPSNPGQITLELEVNGSPFATTDESLAAVVGGVSLGVAGDSTPEGCVRYFIGWEDKLEGGDRDFSDLVVSVDICPAVESPTCQHGGGGDPHFTTFGNHHYDFQGECDLALVQNSGYKDGKGMYIHTRTKMFGSWSSIVSAAVMIGDDVIEVHGEDLALINGVEYPVPAIEGSEFNFPMTIGGYSLTVQILGPHSRRHIIHMGDGEKIFINNFKEFVDVWSQGEKAEDYDGAVGMLGAYSQGGAMMGRDGQTVFEDADAFGQEWQVNPTDPHLFHIIDGPQYPARCNMPEAPTAEQRHLRAMAKKVSEDDAKKACAKASASRIENCISDVFGSDNLDMAGIYTMP